ncbi:putative amidohydrolase [Bernardetia litoralis DSM 6794]|uniref:Omega-amidase YafV n=1 Tax=Bernardetia litoralis (strain ATCC 23117 / DSM 6794 / NBRC 15988 / NCIMB 1366 / Fx l1 / Sio-4) TaxID=880071 RepID=I4AKS9_BERLS|nr:amidohydrolase [Bernardetia litoralis]AFM04564.1 putative amidohydrolase [Bernardetia litoralis DSM 6794]
MKPLLNISLLETDLFWENAVQNRNQFDKIFSSFFMENKQVDILVLPEMFTTAFTMNIDLAEKIEDSTTLNWLKENAKKHNIAITGSIIIEDNKKIYNRLFFVEPSGNVQMYDKRHLFRMAGEHQFFTAGEKLSIFEYKGWKICPQICYDLRFPVFSRNNLMVDEDGIATSGYDILLYVANFPAARSLAWNNLLPARAIENSCYCIGLNRIGKDGKGIEYNGDSAIYHPKGMKLEVIETEIKNTNVLSYSLSAIDLQKYRKKFAVYLDNDNFELK